MKWAERSRGHIIALMHNHTQYRSRFCAAAAATTALLSLPRSHWGPFRGSRKRLLSFFFLLANSTQSFARWSSGARRTEDFAKESFNPFYRLMIAFSTSRHPESLFFLLFWRQLILRGVPTSLEMFASEASNIQNNFIFTTKTCILLHKIAFWAFFVKCKNENGIFRQFFSNYLM